MRYRLTQSLLKISEKKYIKELIDAKFIFQNHDYSTSNSIANSVERDLLLAPAINQLVLDTRRGWKLNDIDFSKALSHSQSATVQAKALSAAVKTIFPQETAKLLLRIHCQNPTYLIGGYALSIDSSTNLKQPPVFTVSQSENTLKVNIYSYGNKAYIDAQLKSYKVLDEKTGDCLELNHQQTSVTCVATKKGYEFLEENTDSMMVYDITMGVVPDSLDWFKKRDQNNWTWAEKNLRICEPIFSDSFIEPLSHRLKNAFHKVFNDDNAHRSDTAAFFSWPNKSYSPAIQFAFYLFSGEFLNLFKNIIKLGTEFLPAIIQETGSCMLDHGKKHFSDPKNRHWNMPSFAAGASTLIGGLFYGIGKIIRQTTMRITSPLYSLKNAYAFGEKTHGKGLGIVLATLSALVSIAGIGSIGLCAGVFLAPVIGIKMAAGLLSGIGIAQPLVSTIINSNRIHKRQNNPTEVLNQVRNTCFFTPDPEKKPGKDTKHIQSKIGKPSQSTAPAASTSYLSSLTSWFSFGKSSKPKPEKKASNTSSTPAIDRLRCKTTLN